VSLLSHATISISFCNGARHPIIHPPHRPHWRAGKGQASVLPADAFVGLGDFLGRFASFGPKLARPSRESGYRKPSVGPGDVAGMGSDVPNLFEPVGWVKVILLLWHYGFVRGSKRQRSQPRFLLRAIPLLCAALRASTSSCRLAGFACCCLMYS
jgi:hypothetical protein